MKTGHRRKPLCACLLRQESSIFHSCSILVSRGTNEGQHPSGLRDRDRLAAALARAQEVERLLSDSASLRDAGKFAELGREHRRLAPVVEMAGRLQKAENELAQVRELVSIDDPEMADEARAEQGRLE